MENLPALIGGAIRQGGADMGFSIFRRNWLLLSFLIFLPCHGPSATEDSRSFPLGLRPPTEQERAWVETHSLRKRTPAKSPGELPTAVKNVEFLPRVGYQTLPNCGAFAPSYYLGTYLQARMRGWGRADSPDRLMSPGIAYAFGQADVGGGSIQGTIMLMCDLGILPLSRLPDSYHYDRSIYPPARLLLEAMPYRGGQPVSFNGRTEEGILAIKEWLAEGELAVFALGISSSTFDYGRSEIPGVDNDVIYDRGGSLRDGHAFTLIGYDDTRTYHDGTEERQGAFYAVNSWGTGWGVEDPDVGTGGFLWVGYEYFREASYSVMSMTEGRLADPEWVALLEYEHPYSTQVLITFYGGNPENPDWERPWVRFSPSENTAYARFNPLAVDFTHYEGEQSEAFWCRITNIGSIPGLPHPAAGGMVHDWRLYRYDELLDALPTRLFDVVMGGYRWNTTPIDGINASHIAAEGLPLETAIMDWQGDIYTEIPLGLMDRGEDFPETPVALGDALFADLNDSGLPDLVVVGGGDETGTVVFENLGGTFRRVEGHGLGGYTGAAIAAGDFNRDGLPDLAIYGRKDGSPTTTIYENLGGLLFRDIGADLAGANAREGIFAGSIAWGDYDNDGLDDLTYWSFGTKQLYLYRNRGDGSFERAPFEFPNRWEGGRVAWHDVNANGLLDLSWGSNVFLNLGHGEISVSPIGFSDLDHSGLGGGGLWADFSGNGLPDLARYRVYQETEDNIVHTFHRVDFYRNLGDGRLGLPQATLHNLHFPRMLAIDWNNNGRMDFLSSHYTGTTWSGSYSSAVPRETAVFRQLSDGSFRHAGFDLLGTVDGANAFADIDGDGDLDLLTMGMIQVEGGGPFQRGSRLHRGLFAQSPFESLANTPPEAPSNLVADGSKAVDGIVLTWDHGTDEQTPRAALAYSVRVGTWPGASNIVSPASYAPVTPVLRYHRLASDQPGLLLRNLPPGHYYWSVRTVDGGHMASDWAAEQSFFLLDGYIVEDLNQDSVFDAADLVRFSRMVGDFRDTLPLEYDFSQDGRISQADIRTLARRLLGSAVPFPGEYNIGPEGGTIVQDNLELTIPAGVFPGSAILTIELTNPGDAYEPGEAPEVYQITGLPITTTGPWYITLRPHQPAPEMPLVLLGEESFAFGGGGTVEMRYRFEEPEILADGRYRIEIPRGEDPDGAGKSPGENTYTHNVGVLNLGGITKYAGPRFAIYFPAAHAGATIENLMDGLEGAYRILRDEYGFSYGRRTRWPVDVYVKKNKPPRPGEAPPDGEMVTTTRGLNHGYINIHVDILEDFERTRVTAAHEFFHVVQGLYDPSGRISQAWRSTYPRYWLDEAMSSWAEELVASDRANYVPTPCLQNADAPFLGVGTGIHGDAETAPEYGYGMAPLVKYLVDIGQGSALLSIYTSTLAGEGPVEALEASRTDFPIRIWYDDFFRHLVEGRIYRNDNPAEHLIGIAGGPRRLRLQPSTGPTVSWRSFDVALPDLAASPHPAFFTADYPAPPADAFFVVRLEGDPTLGLQFFQIPEDEQGRRVASAFGTTEVKYGTIPDALDYWTRRAHFLTLVSNTNTESPHTMEREGTLSIGLARPGPFQVSSNSVSAISYGRPFPTFTASGTIGAEALSDYFETPLTGGIQMTQAAAWGRDSVELSIEYQATVDSLSTTYAEAGRTITLSIDGIDAFSLYKSDRDGNFLESHTSDTGSFTVLTTDSDREEGMAVYDVRAAFTLSRQVDGEAPSTTSGEWPLAYLLFHLP